jgi:hypothetical protein
MALTGAQYMSMRTKFLGLMGSPYQGVSSAELDSFLGQLIGEVTGSVTTTQKNNADSMLAGYLTSPVYTATAANVAEFFSAAVAALPAIVTALTGPRYLQLKQQFTGVLSYAGIRTAAEMLGYMAPYLLTGDFGALFLSYGLAVRRYNRGDLGVTGTQGTGKASWANQLGDGSAITPGAAASSNGIGSVGTGLNGKASIVTDGTTQNGQYTHPTSSAPGTLNHHIYAVERVLVTPVSVGYMHSANSNPVVFVIGGQTSPAADMLCTNGTPLAQTTGVVINQWYRLRASWTDSVADELRVGAHATTGIDMGAGAMGTQWGFGAAYNGTVLVSIETLLLMHIEGPKATFLTACADADAKARTYWTTAIEI